MLISCFQCRQQLDVPEDSAGKRVRCPHCQYVIVVPTKSKPVEAEEVQMPAMALPSMDLDTDGERQSPATKIAAQPLPPIETPPAPSVKMEPKSDPSMDELPPVPSI